MTTDPTPEEKPTKVEDSRADAMDDFELPSQQEGAQRMIVCEGGCEWFQSEIRKLQIILSPRAIPASWSCSGESDALISSSSPYLSGQFLGMHG